MIARAVKHEQRLQFHSDTIITGVPPGALEFLFWVRSLIPAEKYLIFEKLFRLPVATNDLVESIVVELKRVFKGRNRTSTYQFENSKLKDDWMWYKTDVLNLNSRIETEGVDVMKTAINSIVVVDVHDKPVNGKLPEPYYYIVGIADVCGFELDTDNAFEWICFKQEDAKYAYIDKERYVIVNEGQNGEYSIEREQAHPLGYTPARFFWTEALSSKIPALKKSPLSKLLSKLDWLVFFETSKKHLDLYAPYPIYSAYAQDCDYSNPETGDFCDSGFLKKTEGGYKIQDGIAQKCPVCETNKPAGVGAFIQVPQPTADVDMRKPVDVTTIDVDSLNYNVSEVSRLKEEIYLKAVGINQSPDKDAVNTLQATLGYEGKQTILQYWKVNFEYIEEWITETCCKFRYGKGFHSVSIDYGSEFYVYTLGELYTQYKQAKDSGMSDTVLDGISNKIVETEYQNNPVELQRLNILKHLEPYRHLSNTVAVELFSKGIIQDKNQLLVKLNLSSYIAQFERENGSILEFALNKEFHQKIDIINETLKKYANEENRSVGTQPATTESQQGQQ